ncbi:IMPACT [Cervus elaphus hippelaphus]|uniref:IMPACT n=1 Tax=Cervus elaphus hippelaphus TaxID=46360 RepID=A0A212C6F2_CEREH|nr:IMPACT [Cervus elaphus hippelaphus]
MSHIHIGPDIKKKTEEEDVECEDDLVLACQPENQVKTLDFDVSENRTEIEELPPIDHGIPITDRRSTFQAHLAPVVCPKQVNLLCPVHFDGVVPNISRFQSITLLYGFLEYTVRISRPSYRTVRMTGKQQLVGAFSISWRF